MSAHKILSLVLVGTQNSFTGFGWYTQNTFTGGGGYTQNTFTGGGGYTQNTFTGGGYIQNIFTSVLQVHTRVVVY